MSNESLSAKLKKHAIPFLWGAVLGLILFVMRQSQGDAISPLWVLVTGVTFAVGQAMRVRYAEGKAKK